MKLKLLFFPLMLIASISVLVAFVWPEISNIRKVMAENKIAEEKIALIKEKKDIVRSLDQELGKNSDKEKIMKDYLAEGKNEERIINSLNYLAVSTGVSLVDASVVADSDVTAIEEKEEDIPTSNNVFNFSQEPISPSQVTIPVDLKNVSFNISITGKYENIKAFLSGMNRLELMNNIKLVDITQYKAESTEGEESQSTELLSVEVSSEFYYLEKMKVPGSYGLTALNASNFDFSQVDKIKQFISQGASVLEVGERGNKNPFVAF
ncbi:MAG: hypothetical protein ACD_11C00074G0002 [uncultured bacterium]|nr:MAG: hypothetical protein ACD_11C00074G0002 [uncultured bacterium]